MLAQDEATGAGMSDRQLRDEVVTLMIAGHETTANALAWTVYLSARHADEEAKAVAEIQTVLGDRPPAYDDLGALGCVRRVIEESMRLFPPAWAISRAPLVDDAIGGAVRYGAHRPAPLREIARFLRSSVVATTR